MPLSGIDRSPPDVTTTDDTPTLISTMNIPNGTDVTIDYMVVARRPDNGDSISWRRRAHVQNENDTVVLIDDADISAPMKTGQLSWTVTAGSDASGFRLVATGASNTTIDWVCKSDSCGIKDAE